MSWIEGGGEGIVPFLRLALPIRGQSITSFKCNVPIIERTSSFMTMHIVLHCITAFALKHGVEGAKALSYGFLFSFLFRKT